VWDLYRRRATSSAVLLSLWFQHQINVQQGTEAAPVIYMCSQVVADPEGLLGVRNETESKKLRKVSCCGLCQPPTSSCSVRRSPMTLMCRAQKPASYRLACQTNTGDGETGGEGVIVRNKPK